MPVVAAVCFVGGDWCMAGAVVSMDSVVVCGVGGRRRLLRRRGGLGPAERRHLAQVLDDGMPDQLNLQDRGGQAKPYQLRQLVGLVRPYDLSVQEKL